jgi:beta-phosphoglucomutase-like phosphatase (HAD superfamily)
MPSAHDLVIFDNDGVLVDSEPIAADVLAHLLNEHGLPTAPEDAMRDFIGASMERVRQVSEARLGGQLPDDFERRYYDALFVRYPGELRAVEGAAFALARIDLPKCVASSGSLERIRRSLRLVRLWGHFEGRAFSADEVERGKPAPDLFLRAAEMMGVDPSRCAVIEDSPLGIEAANAAGMTSFGFARRTPAERLRRATGGLFSDMSQLPQLLRAPHGPRRG